MVIEPKVNLTIILPGRVLLSQEEADTLEKEQRGSGYNKLETMVVEDTRKKKSRETISFRTRKCRTACQSINLCKEAYHHMIDKNSCPEWSRNKQWATMSKKERLESHLQRISESLGGISFTYKIFED